MRTHHRARSAAAVWAGARPWEIPLCSSKPAHPAWIPPSLESLPPLSPFLGYRSPQDSRLRSRHALGAGSRCNRGNYSPWLSGPLPLNRYPLASLNHTPTLPHPALLATPGPSFYITSYITRFTAHLNGRDCPGFTPVGWCTGEWLRILGVFPPSIFLFSCRTYHLSLVVKFSAHQSFSIRWNQPVSPPTLPTPPVLLVPQE